MMAPATAFSRDRVERLRPLLQCRERDRTANPDPAGGRLRFFHGRAQLDDDRGVDPGDGEEPRRKPAAAQPGDHQLPAAVTAGFALFDADTPHWIIVVAVLVAGCIRSVKYLALNTISYADMPSALLSRSTSVGGVAQQLARGFGVAIGAALLALVVGSERITTEDFRVVFLLVALIPLFSALGFLRLRPTDGAEVSGHRAAQPAAAKAG
jgi:hypothetical protein